MISEKEQKEWIEKASAEDIKQALKQMFYIMEKYLQKDKNLELLSIARNTRGTRIGREVSQLINQERRGEIKSLMEKTKEERIQEEEVKQEPAPEKKKQEKKQAPAKVENKKEEAEEAPTENIEEELKKLSSNDLKALAASRGIKNSSKMRKADLIKELMKLYE